MGSIVRGRPRAGALHAGAIGAVSTASLEFLVFEIEVEDRHLQRVARALGVVGRNHAEEILAAIQLDRSRSCARARRSSACRFRTGGADIPAAPRARPGSSSRRRTSGRRPRRRPTACRSGARRGGRRPRSRDPSGRASRAGRRCRRSGAGTPAASRFPPSAPSSLLREPPEVARVATKRGGLQAPSEIAALFSARIWSIVRAGSAQPASPTTRAGTPATVVLCGTGDSTTEPDATRAQWPTSILPRIFAPAPISTPWRIFGWRSPISLPVPPSVTPCRIETSSSITAVSPITIAGRVIEEDALAELRGRIDVDLEHGRRAALQIEREIAPPASSAAHAPADASASA